MNLRTVTVIVICFTIAISSLYLVNDWHRTNFDAEKVRLNWYSEVDETQTKGFLIGNSAFFVLDELLISDHLFQNGKNVTIYDLAIGGKLADYWLDHLEGIIFSKPEIVVIGIDPVNFVGNQKKKVALEGFWSVNSLQTNSNRLIGDKLLSLNFYSLDTNNFKNPKLTTLKIIQFLETGIPDNNVNQIPTQPFFSGGDKLYIITNRDELPQREKFKINIPQDGEKELALIEIIQTLQKNNINTVLIVTPRPQAYLEPWDNDSKKDWNELLNRLEQQTQIKIYNLQNQFSDLNIFADLHHVTRLPEGKIYSEEVARIILLELDG